MIQKKKESQRASYPCSILTRTGGGGASGTLWGNPGPLAGAPTSDMSGILWRKEKFRKTVMTGNHEMTSTCTLCQN